MALKQRKKNTQLSRAQVKFLLEIYNESEISGKKTDPSSVVQMMKCSTKESGDKLFRLNEYLRKEQIAAFFSRLTYQRRKGNTLAEDIVNTSDDDEVDSTEENTTECGDESDKEEGEGEQDKEERFGEKEDSESNYSDEEKEDEDDSEFDEDLLCAIEDDVSDLKMQNDLKTMCQTLSVVNASIKQCKYSKDDSNDDDEAWEVVPVYGDGNCLFRAIACGRNYSLLSCARNEGGYPTDAQYADLEKNSAHELRLKAVSMLRSIIERHARDLGLEYLWDKYGSMEMHLREMAKNSEYGGQPEILALTQVLERTTVVHYKGSDKTTTFEEYFSSQPAIHILYYEEEIDEEGKQQKAGHYNLLKRVTSLTQGTSDAVVSSVGDYMAVRLGKSTLYMAIITEDDNETKEVKVKFMEKSGTLFTFSDEEEKWVSVSTIIHKCSVSCMDTQMRYSFDAIDIRHTHEKMKLKMKLRK